MRSHSRPTLMLLALGFGASLAGCGGESPGAPVTATTSTPALTPASLQTTRTITLITGDRVHLQRTPDGTSSVAVEPGPGRAPIGFSQTVRKYADHEDISVVPRDAAPLLAAGKLDPRLFNVSELVREGLDDHMRATVPLIVTHARGVARPRALPHAGARLGRALTSVNASVLVAQKQNAAELWSWVVRADQAGIDKIWLDARKHVVDDESNPQIGAPVAWQAGFTGTGVVVADLDTGYDPTHPDLQGVVIDAVDFSHSEAGVTDNVGHGTHTATTIAGTGAASAGKYRGVAPEAKLLIGKVCGDDGGCYDSDIIAGMEWAAEQHATVVNMSLGGYPTDGTDPMSLSVNNLTASANMLFVIAAGNDGADFSVGSPGSADAALTVGSVTKDDELSYFSSRGPRIGDRAIKPDLVAPGSSIIAGRAAGVSFGGGDIDEYYTTLSGTSMATPHVTGAVAILAQQHPDWTAEQLKAGLVSTTHTLDGYSVYAQGSGRLDVGRAVTQAVHATSGSLSFGLVAYPYDQPPAPRTVTYRNDGDGDVTLDLEVAVDDASGAPAAAGVFTVDATQVTVPAHGSTSVTVAQHPEVGAIGLYSGRLIASDASNRVVTALGVFKEPESYDLVLHVINHSGLPGNEADVTFVDLTTGALFGVGIGDFDAQGTARLRVPKGRYDVISYILEPPGVEALAAVVKPGVTIDAPVELTFDGQLAKPVSLQVDRPTSIAEIGLDVASLVDGQGLVRNFTFGMPGQLYATPTATIEDHDFAFVIRAVLTPPADAPATAGSIPYLYNLVLPTRGQVPEQLAFHPRDRELAQVVASYKSQGAPVNAIRGAFGVVSYAVPAFALVPLYELPVPGRRLELYSVASELSWQHTLWAQAAEGGAGIETVFGTEMHPRGLSFQDWLRAPFGPSFGAPGGDFLGVRRGGDELRVDVPLFSPSEEEHQTMSFWADGFTGTTSLSRDGEVLGTSAYPGFGSFRVPEGAGVYTLRAVADRHVPWSVLATHVDAAWTFASATSAQVVYGPLSVVRVTAPVDDEGAAGAGQLFPLALHVQQQPGAAAATVAGIGLEVSYDDGVTWKRALVLRVGSRGVALIRHPAGDGFVSLRVSARDSAGGSVSQTVLRAYRLVAQR